MMMGSRRLALAVALAAVWIPSLILASGATDSTEVAVEYSPPILTVRVIAATNLEAVMKELCQATQARCDLIPELAGVAVEPITLTGTWANVVALLLEGTGFNVATVEPTRARRGVLLISERPKGIDSPATKLGSSHPDTKLGRSSDDADRAILEQEEKERESSERPERPSSYGAVDSSLAGESGIEQRDVEVLPSDADAQPSPEQQRNSDAAIRNMYLGPAVRPAVVPPPPGMAVLPYPDANGNPIYIPITNQPITMLPYPDAQGRPIYVAPGTPGLKLQNPVPPNTKP